MPASTRLLATLAAAALLFCGAMFLMPRGVVRRVPVNTPDTPLPAYPAAVAQGVASPPNDADPALRSPLFFRERRPRVASFQLDGGVTNATPSLDAVLTGIVRSDRVNIASLQVGGRQLPVRIALGGESPEFPGWRLVDLGPVRARLRNGDSTVELKLDRHRASGSSAPPPQAVVVPPRSESLPTTGVEPARALSPVAAPSTMTPPPPAETLTPSQQADAVRRRIDAARRAMKQSGTPQ